MAKIYVSTTHEGKEHVVRFGDSHEFDDVRSAIEAAEKLPWLVERGFGVWNGSDLVHTTLETKDG